MQMVQVNEYGTLTLKSVTIQTSDDSYIAMTERSVAEGEQHRGAGNGLRPTLRTLAEATGLGVTTVSRALKDGSEIALATRERVKRAAEQIGYVPDVAGRRLRTGKSGTVALLLSPHPEVTGFGLSMIAGLTRALEGTGRELLVVPDFQPGDELAAVRSVLDGRRADGLVLSRIRPQDIRVRALLERDVPFVTHGRTELATVHASHDLDNAELARLAVERLIARGRRRLLLVPPARGFTYRVHMQIGFERAVQRAGAEIVSPPDPSFDLDLPLDELRAHVAAAVAAEHAPDGIVCGGDGATLATLAGVVDAGRRPGIDVDVVGKQTSPALDHVMPPIDTLHEDLEAAGVALGTQLLALLDGAAPDGLCTLAAPLPRWRTTLDPVDDPVTDTFHHPRSFP